MQQFLKSYLRNFFLVAILATSSCAINSKVQKETLQSKEIVKQETPPPPIKLLKKIFRTNYDEAIKIKQQKMMASSPIIIQDFLNMTLFLSNGSKHRFNMDKELYFKLAHVSHPVLTVYSIIKQEEFGTLSESQLLKIKELSGAIALMKASLEKNDNLDTTDKRILNLLSATETFTKQLLHSKKANKEDFENYARTSSILIQKNFELGAEEQLAQFMSQMNSWKHAYPNENWTNLKVVVLGFHQARNKYVLKEFFKWLLNEPDFEKNVVFAEFQFNIFGKNRSKAEEKALELLTKVVFEQEASELIFNDIKVFQSDVMGPAGEKIIKTWGSSDWN